MDVPQDRNIQVRVRNQVLLLRCAVFVCVYVKVKRFQSSGNIYIATDACACEWACLCDDDDECCCLEVGPRATPSPGPCVWMEYLGIGMAECVCACGVERSSLQDTDDDEENKGVGECKFS